MPGSRCYLRSSTLLCLRVPGQQVVLTCSSRPALCMVCVSEDMHPSFSPRPGRMAFHGCASSFVLPFLSCPSWRQIRTARPELCLDTVRSRIPRFIRWLFNVCVSVSNMTAICGIISWTCVLWTSIRWHRGLKVQGIDRSTLPYRAPFQPYLSYCKLREKKSLVTHIASANLGFYPQRRYHRLYLGAYLRWLLFIQ